MSDRGVIDVPLGTELGEPIGGEYVPTEVRRGVVRRPARPRPEHAITPALERVEESGKRWNAPKLRSEVLALFRACGVTDNGDPIIGVARGRRVTP